MPINIYLLNVILARHSCIHCTFFISWLCFREQRRGQQEREGWGEINAAMALTHLAQGPQMCLSPSSPGRSGTRGPTSTAMTNSVGKACTLGPTGSPWQSCTVGSIISVGNTLTRRIIQKSSHISEIQTVKLARANSL